MYKLHNYILSALFAAIALLAFIGAIFLGAWHQLFTAFMATCVSITLYIDNRQTHGK